MTILSIDSTGKTGTYAIINEEEIVGEVTIKHSLKHGETQMVLLDILQKTLSFDFHALDGIACSIGPGSFTGIRVGMATAKGLAMAYNIPIAGVSTLEALAYNVYGNLFVVPILDARRNQVYTAAFRFETDTYQKVLPYQTLSISDLLDTIESFETKALFVGDGTLAYKNEILSYGHAVAPLHLNEQRASSVGYVALKNKELFQDKSLLQADYVRPSQAERERGQL